MPSSCGRNVIFPALRSSTGFENSLRSSLIYKSEGLWTSIPRVGRREARAMAAAGLCLCCWTAASSSVPGRVQKGNTDPEPGGSLAFGMVTASRVAQNRNVGGREGWVWNKLLLLETHLHLQPSPSVVRARRAIGTHSCGSCPSDYQGTAWKSLLVCFQKRHLPCSCCLFPCVSGLSQGCDSPFLLGRAFFHNHCVAICVLLLWEGSRWVQETAKPRGLWVELLYGGISVCSEIVKENKWIFWQWRQMTAERSALVNSVSKEWVINVKTASRWWCLKFLSDVCRTSILVDCVHSGPRALEKHWAVSPCWVPLFRHEQG